MYRTGDRVMKMIYYRIESPPVDVEFFGCGG